IKRCGGRNGGGVEVGRRKLEEVNEFKYLGMLVEGNGGTEKEIKNRVVEGMKVLGGLREVWKKGKISKEIKIRMFECMCLPSVMYVCETWMLSARARKSLNVFEMKGLRAICKLRRIDRIRNERIREMCKWKRGVGDRWEESVLKWYEHMCRMNEDRMVGKVFRSEVDGGRGGKGQSGDGWME